MVQNLGNATAYVAATGSRPLPPRPADGGVRRAHQPQPKKPTGLDWNQLTPKCRACGEKSTQLDNNDTCPTCRGITASATPTTKRKGKKARDTAFPTLPEDELIRRYTGPDDTRLGRELAELEATDPKVAAAAAALDDAVRRVVRPDDHVRADALSVDEPAGRWRVERMSGFRISHPFVAVAPGCVTEPHPTRDCGCKVFTDREAADTYIAGLATEGPTGDIPAKTIPTNVTPPTPPRRTDEGDGSGPASAGAEPRDSAATELDYQITHATQVLRDTAGHQHPAVRLLRLNALAAVEALHLFVELNHPTEIQTPAPAGSPRPANAGRTRPAARLTDEQRTEIVAAYVAGATSAEAGRRYGLRAETVRHLVVAAGHTVRPRGGGRAAATTARLAALGTTAADVKAWGVRHGLLNHIAPGHPPARVIDAYEHAHPQEERP